MLTRMPAENLNDCLTLLAAVHHKLTTGTPERASPRNGDLSAFDSEPLQSSLRLACTADVNSCSLEFARALSR
jgi:hypothetical protein